MHKTTLLVSMLVAAAAVFTAGFGMGVATRTVAGMAKLAALSALVATGVFVVVRYLPRQG